MSQFRSSSHDEPQAKLSGPTSSDSINEEDPRLFQAAQAYLAELEAGHIPDRRDFLNRFPGLTGAIVPYLDALDAVHAGLSQVPSQPRMTSAPAGEPLPVEPLGDFRIVEEIGRGGMGTVYEAVQLSLGRRVALKVLPFAAALDTKQLQRFKNEAQAAAHLHHPNIVPVYAVGEERGVHFYAMQLIEGQNLATLVEELRKGGSNVTFRPWRDGEKTLAALAARAGMREAQSAAVGPEGDATGPYPSTSGPREGLASPHPPGDGPRGGKAGPHPPGQDCAAPTHTGSLMTLGAQLTTQRSERDRKFYQTVAQLVAQAAAALHYAHEVGVVHRDVKPANLLVDALGKVWVTDFGLAQFHAEVGLTQTGDLLGTLRYMSPEQASGQRVLIDHRTDIYSLGATLYELLTLRPIFDGADRQALLHQILNEEPPSPRALERSIPPELETIVLKAVGKSPTDRYATAREFAEDLQRFLEDRPIRARRASLVEKMTKWARRHRAVVVSGVCALLLSVAGLSVATVLAAHAYKRERQKAVEAEQQRQRAEESFRQARRAVDQFTQISEEELAGDPRLGRLRRRMLKTALAYYQDFISQQQNEPKLQRELEASHAKVEAIHAELVTLMGAGKYALLHREHVQDELGLSEGQRKGLAQIDQLWREGFRESRHLAPKEWERRRLALALRQETEVAQLLTKGQIRRFQQLALQDSGLRAFTEPEVVTALGLTAAQQKRIRRIAEEANSRTRSLKRRGPRGWGSRTRREGDKPTIDPRKKGMKQILALLTPEQKQKWKKMVGKPFQNMNVSSHPHRGKS